MFKKIKMLKIPIIVSVVFGITICCLFYLNNNKYQNIPKNETERINDNFNIEENNDNDSVVNEVEEVVDENISSTKVEVNNEKKNEIKQEQKLPTKNIDNNTIPNSDNNTVNEIINENTNNNETTQNENNQNEKLKETIDKEYEMLKAQIEYSTYEECMNAGFEIALSDTVNILGFDPIEIIYKGKVIGYKLKIHYTNPMEN